MKNFLRVFVVAGMAMSVIASCSKTGPQRKNAIAFKVSGVESKGVVVTTANLPTEYGAFTVDAYLTTAVSGQNTHYMNSVPVNYSSGKWTVDGTYYWLNDVPVDFFSYAPARTEIGDNVMSDISYDNSAATFSFDYTMAWDFGDLIQGIEDSYRPTILDQKDIIVAYSRQSSGEGDIKVAFRHALAAVELDATGIFESDGNDDVEMVMCGIIGIGNNATCTVGSEGVSWSGQNGDLGTFSRLDKDSSSDYYYKSDTYKGYCFYIIPQTAGEDACLVLSGLFCDGTYPSYTESSIQGQKFEAGKKYRYKLKKTGMNWQWVLESVNGEIVGYDFQEQNGI